MVTKELAQSLRREAVRVAQVLSDPNRQKNQNKETFTLHEIIPLSETVAAVIYDKSSGKRAAAIFLWVEVNNGMWLNTIPTDSHILGMVSFKKHKDAVEKYNYRFNFDER